MRTIVVLLLRLHSLILKGIFLLYLEVEVILLMLILLKLLFVGTCARLRWSFFRAAFLASKSRAPSATQRDIVG